MTGQPRTIRGTVASALAAALTAAACGQSPSPANHATAPPVTLTTPRGGELLVSVRTEPKSFSWYTQGDATTYLMTFLSQAGLVRVNRATQEVEPWLAESWARSGDGLKYTLKLRPNVTFADGHPFTADDVVFSFTAAYDMKAGGPRMADTLSVDHKPLTVTPLDPLTVLLTFPAPYSPGLRLLDELPMLPRHKLAAALAAGTFQSAWSLSSPVTDVTGLGPFVLSDYRPGQRVVFSRNERYFRKDSSGGSLPYLDRVVLDVIPDQNAQVLRLEAGQSDMLSDEIRLEDYARLKRAATAGRVQLFDLGGSVVPDSFWINLKPGAFLNDPRASWIQRDELRQAISLAVDRQVFIDTVYLGAGVPVFGPITPANKKWYSPDMPHTPHDPARAKELLARIGLTDRDADGVLEDARGAPARFSLVTQKGKSANERGAAVIRDELKKIGLLVDVVGLEGNALVDRLQSGRGYESALFQLQITDTDPALQLQLWLSAGAYHVWNLGQKTPATPWEKQIDELMGRQSAALDDAERKRLFDEVQKVFADHVPIVHFAAPSILVAASSRVMNLVPAVLRPQLLWSAESIAVKP